MYTVPPQREVLVSYVLQANNNTLIMMRSAPLAQNCKLTSAEFTLLKFSVWLLTVSLTLRAKYCLCPVTSRLLHSITHDSTHEGVISALTEDLSKQRVRERQRERKRDRSRNSWILLYVKAQSKFNTNFLKYTRISQKDTMILWWENILAYYADCHPKTKFDIFIFNFKT